MSNIIPTQIPAQSTKAYTLEFDMLQKVYYLRKEDQLVWHTFGLLICRRNANTTE